MMFWNVHGLADLVNLDDHYKNVCKMNIPIICLCVRTRSVKGFDNYNLASVPALSLFKRRRASGGIAVLIDKTRG